MDACPVKNARKRIYSKKLNKNREARAIACPGITALMLIAVSQFG
jgi:hypothetical protein